MEGELLGDGEVDGDVDGDGDELGEGDGDWPAVMLADTCRGARLEPLIVLANLEYHHILGTCKVLATYKRAESSDDLEEEVSASTSTTRGETARLTSRTIAST